jgi:hypothetical protein
LLVENRFLLAAGNSVQRLYGSGEKIVSILTDAAVLHVLSHESDIRFGIPAGDVIFGAPRMKLGEKHQLLKSLAHPGVNRTTGTGGTDTVPGNRNPKALSFGEQNITEILKMIGVGRHITPYIFLTMARIF